MTAMVLGMLGLLPAAPWRTLIVDPGLPEWLPEVTLAGIGVGEASATLRFRRRPDGSTGCEILDRRGELHIRRAADRPAGADRRLLELDALAGGIAAHDAEAHNVGS